MTRKWEKKGSIKDDPDRKVPFFFGTLSFAGSGENTRDTSIFIATSSEPHQLAGFGTQLWERAVGIVTEGKTTINNLYTGYGDMVR